MTTFATICVTFNYRLLIKIVLKKRKLIACTIYLFDRTCRWLLPFWKFIYVIIFGLKLLSFCLITTNTRKVTAFYGWH